MIWSLLTLMHLVGLVLAVGAATVKLFLLLKSKSNYSFAPVYLNVSNSITKLILIGIVLLTLSGIGWLLYGYPFTQVLIIKIILVAVIWILGPVIDKVIEPKFRKLAPATDQAASAEFIRAQKNYLAIEITATGLFYIIIVMWVLS